MKNYLARIPWNCTVLVKVEAENENEAIEKALKKCNPNLCHQCSNEIEIDEYNADQEAWAEEI